MKIERSIKHITDGTITNTSMVASATITSFAGTVSAGGARTVIFSEAADCALCKIGSTLIADGDTRIIIALPGSPNVTVDADTTWGAATAITSLTNPISQLKKADGTVVGYINVLSGIGLVGGTGTQKGVAFNDGDTELFESDDDTLIFKCGGVNSWHINKDYFGYLGTNYPTIRHEAASSTNPNIIPSSYDFDTGVGSPLTIDDQLSLIAGGIEAIRLTETTTKMVEKFACNALGGVGRVAFSATANITADATVTIQVNIPAGAKILEKHFTSDKNWPGPDVPLSIEPEQLRELIAGAEAIHKACGGSKNILEEEQPTIDFAYACVVSTRDIMAGDRFTEDNIWVKRPGTGQIKAADYKEVLGKRAKVDIKSNCQIRFCDIV